MSIKNCLIAIFTFALIGCQSGGGEKDKYLQQSPPGIQPEIFAPGLISLKDTVEFGSVFSKDGLEFFYAIEINGKSEILTTRFESGKWSKSQIIISHPTYGYNDPYLSNDEQRLYFISKQRTDSQVEKNDHDIWYALREEAGWSAPINAGPAINSDSSEYYISFNQDGDMYYSSNVNADSVFFYNFDIYVSKKIDGIFQPGKALSDSINTQRYEADVYVAPDESYLIFSSQRPGSLGRGDLYISWKGEDGKWGKASNMGAPINSENHELCPFVTADGKYLFYTSNGDIYWVSTQIFKSETIESK